MSNGNYKLLFPSVRPFEATFHMNAAQTKRQAYNKEAVNFFGSASAFAEAGDLDSAAVFIIKALDQERRACGVGPQVLQLIKPRP